MEKTKLWQIVRRMPKGTLLHAHCDAMVDFDYLFDVVLATPGMHVRADGHLATEAARQDQGGIAFAFREAESPADPASLWSAAHYVPGTFVPLAKAAEAFPDGGRPGFLRFLKKRCTLSETDARTQHHGVNDIWRRFQACFTTVGAMIHYEPIWRKFLRHLMRSLLEDGIYWVEIRCVWPSPSRQTPPPNMTLTWATRRASHGLSTTAAKESRRPRTTTTTCSRSSTKKSATSAPRPRAPSSGACA